MGPPSFAFGVFVAQNNYHRKFILHYTVHFCCSLYLYEIKRIGVIAIIFL
jgi:hypothetical protein